MEIQKKKKEINNEKEKKKHELEIIKREEKIKQVMKKS